MNDINLYLLNIQKVENYSHDYFSAHFPQRLKKSFEFANKNDALRCLGVAVLLKEVLNLTEKDVLIDENGKPFTKKSNLKFSISHSGEFVALAVSDTEVGIDIEKIDKSRLKVANKVLTSAELNWVNNDPEKFFTVWTLKEALSKAIGIGLKLGFCNTDVLPMTENKAIKYQNINYYGKTAFIDNYVCSVVSESSFKIILKEI